jgi:hypothetical protein
MFGDIAKTFGRNFLVAHLAPAILFITAIVVLVLHGSLILAKWTVWDTFYGLTLHYKVAVLFLAGVFISLGLQQFSTQLIRFYEGYYGRDTWLARKATKKQKAQYNQLLKEITDLRARGERVGLKEYTLSRQYATTGDILPTKLGNNIRAFESYVHAIYNIDPITGWTRLIGVIPKSYQDQLEKAQVDFVFVLNLSFLSALLAIISGVQFIASCYYWMLWWEPLFVALAFFLLSYGLYRLSCSNARDWGEYVRSAFDLYRLDLLNQLGVFAPTTVTLRQEKGLWRLVQQHTFRVEDPGTPEPPNKLEFRPRSSESNEQVSRGGERIGDSRETKEEPNNEEPVNEASKSGS